MSIRISVSSRGAILFVSPFTGTIAFPLRDRLDEECDDSMSKYCFHCMPVQTEAALLEEENQPLRRVHYHHKGRDEDPWERISVPRG